MEFCFWLNTILHCFNWKSQKVLNLLYSSILVQVYSIKNTISLDELFQGPNKLWLDKTWLRTIFINFFPKIQTFYFLKINNKPSLQKFVTKIFHLMAFISQNKATFKNCGDENFHKSTKKHRKLFFQTYKQEIFLFQIFQPLNNFTSIKNKNKLHKNFLPCDVIVPLNLKKNEVENIFSFANMKRLLSQILTAEDFPRACLRFFPPKDAFSRIFVHFAQDKILPHFFFIFNK